jgi:type III secretory pathway component EscV
MRTINTLFGKNPGEWLGKAIPGFLGAMAVMILIAGILLIGVGHIQALDFLATVVLSVALGMGGMMLMTVNKSGDQKDNWKQLSTN